MTASAHLIAAEGVLVLTIGVSRRAHDSADVSRLGGCTKRLESFLRELQRTRVVCSELTYANGKVLCSFGKDSVGHLLPGFRLSDE